MMIRFEILHFFLIFQRVLENARNRSQKLGISNMSKIPSTENNCKVTTTPSRHDSVRSKTASASPSKRRQSTDRKGLASSASVAVNDSPTRKNRAVALRTAGGSSLAESKNSLNIDAKENDVAVEINITTGPNVQVSGKFLFVFFFSLELFTVV